MTITLTIDSDGMGPNATQDDYADFAEYLAERISDVAGVDVEVDPLPWGQAGLTRVDGASSEAERDRVIQAHQRIWDRWCR